MIIYIAGRYNAPTDGQRLFNTDKAIDTGIAVMKKGHYCLVPHLTHYIEKRMDYNGEPPRENSFWYDFDNKIIPKCDALLMTEASGVSMGADMEVALAKKLGIKVYHNIQEIPDA